MGWDSIATLGQTVERFNLATKSNQLRRAGSHPRLATAVGRVSVVVIYMARHLCDHATATEVTEATVFAPRAVFLRDVVLGSDVRPRACHNN